MLVVAADGAEDEVSDDLEDGEDEKDGPAVTDALGDLTRPAREGPGGDGGGGKRRGGRRRRGFRAGIPTRNGFARIGIQPVLEIHSAGSAEGCPGLAFELAPRTADGWISHFFLGS